MLAISPKKRLIKRDQKWTTAFLLEKRLFFHIEHEQRIKDCNLFKNFKHGLINKISSLVYNEYWIWNISCSKSMAGITILKMNFFQSFWIINASSSVDTDDKIWTLFILIKNLIISYFFSFVMDFFSFRIKHKVQVIRNLVIQPYSFGIFWEVVGLPQA